MSSANVFIAVFVAVALAELAGDKTLYTIGSLSTRFAALPLMIGISVAFGAKALVAVAAGRWLAMLPHGFANAVTAAACFVAAIAVARDWRHSSPVTQLPPLREATISCSTVLFSEWGDPGQIATALAATRASSPAIVWLAATAAMMSKALLVMIVGRQLRTLVTPAALRLITFSTCVVAGTFAVAGVQ
jgi:putative Ca2+/H+ antiporter (TMEM165/GDT1 family)